MASAVIRDDGVEKDLALSVCQGRHICFPFSFPDCLCCIFSHLNLTSLCLKLPLCLPSVCVCSSCWFRAAAVCHACQTSIENRSALAVSFFFFHNFLPLSFCSCITIAPPSSAYYWLSILASPLSNMPLIYAIIRERRWP